MTATASRIALSAPESISGVQGHAPAGPEPSSAATEGTRLLPRRDHGGRFVPRAPYPCCESCGRTLAESLTGATYCPWTECGSYREPVGVAAGVDAGMVTAEVLAVGA